ncbi:polyhydroxyalkanoic acid synthase subunit PhaR [Priestia koreensis]|uniref:polyhydroxyalkanoic acid synthase subunit PhaR n=1 Tax=Priestia koreensis TaxID=284581 RepID=UPI0028F735A9|nr:polyhydroxyalkanoic acid synthase subunit PhaR [Priestia koreensis]
MEQLDQQNVFDPFLAWKDMYDKTESYWGKVIGENMNREEFSQWMGKVLNMNLQYQQVVNDTTTRYFGQLNIPSKDDISNVASLVVNVEEKVEELEDRFDVLEDATSANANLKKEFTKLKSDVKSVEKKVDRVLTLLENQEKLQIKLQEQLQAQLQEQIREQSQQLQAQLEDLQEQSEAAVSSEPVNK